ncbi:hypothetical protein AMS66_00935 [Paenibacillus xylanivorans]|uniref:Uncharacterized protein n=1 Tax=Paenibacillus xylanivorans TaxID=1705561 RepID=A0A0M9BUD9_9BACL|nr:hypothetical protein AMS66_00935 [Paenibacillus xylanivorans]
MNLVFWIYKNRPRIVGREHAEFKSFCKILPLKIQKKVLPQDGALFIKNINIKSLIHKPMQ